MNADTSFWSSSEHSRLLGATEIVFSQSERTGSVLTEWRTGMAIRMLGKLKEEWRTMGSQVPESLGIFIY